MKTLYRNKYTANNTLKAMNSYFWANLNKKACKILYFVYELNFFFIVDWNAMQLVIDWIWPLFLENINLYFILKQRRVGVENEFGKKNYAANVLYFENHDKIYFRRKWRDYFIVCCIVLLNGDFEYVSSSRKYWIQFNWLIH